MDLMQTGHAPPLPLDGELEPPLRALDMHLLACAWVANEHAIEVDVLDGLSNLLQFRVGADEAKQVLNLRVDSKGGKGHVRAAA